MKILKVRRMNKSKINPAIQLVIILAGVVVGCRPGFSEPTPTVRPNFIPPTSDPADVRNSGTAPTPLPTRQADCDNQLEFLDDLTIPDGMEVEPGQAIIKRWLVKNTGSCSWNHAYSFQLISGLALGAENIQDLYPARGSTEAVLEIQFNAPDNPGRYNSWWQAYDPDGNRFGDPVYLEISVVSE